jgi:hypothetical protein
MGNDVEELITSALSAAAASLVAPGDWLTGDQRRAAAIQVLDARTNELDEQRRQAISPNAVVGGHTATGELSAEAVEVVHRVASDPGRLTRSWAEQLIAVLGEEAYTELVGVAACAMVLDTFSWALQDNEASFGSSIQGMPANERPEDVGDVGAWVSQSTGSGMANVSRSLSLVPVTNSAWVGLVQAMYSRGPGFLDLEWDRALSRPQVELVAARTTAELECFY